MIDGASASQLLDKRSHGDVDDAAEEAEVRLLVVIQEGGGPPVVEGQNVIKQEEQPPPINADAGLLEPQPP